MTPPVVLLIDDNEDCRIIYGSTLRHAGYAVQTARDGREGVDIANDNCPGLILLDIGMPVMDGMEALALLRADARTSAIPIIAVSARVARDQQQAVQGAGFTEVLLKPIMPGDILAAVKRHLPVGPPAGAS